MESTRRQYQVRFKQRVRRESGRAGERELPERLTIRLTETRKIELRVPYASGTMSHGVQTEAVKERRCGQRA